MSITIQLRCLKLIVRIHSLKCGDGGYNADAAQKRRDSGRLFCTPCPFEAGSRVVVAFKYFQFPLKLL